MFNRAQSSSLFILFSLKKQSVIFYSIGPSPIFSLLSETSKVCLDDFFLTCRKIGTRKNILETNFDFKISSHELNWHGIRVILIIVNNATNVFQACIYKSVKRGLFLKSIVAPRIVKFKILIPVFTFKFLWEKNMIILN